MRDEPKERLRRRLSLVSLCSFAIYRLVFFKDLFQASIESFSLIC